MLAYIKACANVLCVRYAPYLVYAMIFGDELRFVEQRQQVATLFKVGTEIDETTLLVDSLRIEDERIAQSENQMAGVLVLLALVGLVVQEFLEFGIDVVDFHAV